MSADTVRVDPRPSSRWLLTATAVLLLMSVGVQVVRDRGWTPYEPANPMLWLKSGPMARRLSMGFSSLVADVYWMRAVVYYGGKRRAEGGATKNYDLLAPLLELATTLDPRFKIAYRFGAIFLTEAYPDGPARPDQAIALLERGMQNDPTAWEYPYDVGFINYWWLHDYKKAAEWFNRAGDLPKSPDWLKPLAATTLAQGGDRRSSRFLWTRIYESSDVEWLRKSAEMRLLQLNALDEIDAIQQIVARFVSRQNRPPASWGELVTSERLRGIPLDPTGVPYVLEPQTGRVTIAKSSKLWPLPTETRTALP